MITPTELTSEERTTSTDKMASPTLYNRKFHHNYIISMPLFSELELVPKSRKKAKRG